ncbi:glycoside hydrolase family 35 protein [Zopfia rhizophila CBS 207.26]|uniref:Glycoside hydrolase family 35 protein n=1 Tax=Zopfia rhizophila CBS 207.26 TaxID=1314779 RepID=A0A6A6E9T0_9PEZI|nr:glycoside hydrolase family 35 protein [Zopfia rhizophila CBS 207.26]
MWANDECRNEVQYTSSIYAPGFGPGEVDIRGYDNYPLNFVCNATSTWPDGKLSINFWEVNYNHSGGNLNSILEMQAGAHDVRRHKLGRNRFHSSNHELRLRWQNQRPILNARKYSELKLLAQLLPASPAYLTTRPLNQWPVNTVNGSHFTHNKDLAVTQLADVVEWTGSTYPTTLLVTSIRFSTRLVVQGTALQGSSFKGKVVTINYRLDSSQTVLEIGKNLKVIIVNRNTTFNFWVPEYDGGAAIVRAPYLFRSARLDFGTLEIRGDLNVTEPEIEIWADSNVESVNYNSAEISAKWTFHGSIGFRRNVLGGLKVSLPDLSKLDWRYIDGLPEVKGNCSDAKWPDANLRNSTNPRKPTIPTSLYSSNYGFHTNTILSSAVASLRPTSRNPSLPKSKAVPHSLHPSTSTIRILLRDLRHSSQTPHRHITHVRERETYVAWKITGNVGGKKHINRLRGPVNEGGLYLERQGFHQPGTPTSSWSKIRVWKIW